MIGGGGPSGGRRRNLDAEVNLVPFIDLLSMCICFLLMTAVWVQLGSVQVKQSHGTEATAAPAQALELELKYASPTSVEIVAKRAGRATGKATVAPAEVEKALSSIAPVGVEVGSAMITPAASVSYGDLIGLMDSLRKHKVTNIGVVPTRGQGGQG